jgi:hydrogenase expression/formation protein HypC
MTMCLSVPARVISIEGKVAEVSIGGSVFKTGIHMVDNIEVGDYILLHTGFAIQKINEKEALETLRLLQEMDDIINEQ